MIRQPNNFKTYVVCSYFYFSCLPIHCLLLHFLTNNYKYQYQNDNYNSKWVSPTKTTKMWRQLKCTYDWMYYGLLINLIEIELFILLWWKIHFGIVWGKQFDDGTTNQYLGLGLNNDRWILDNRLHNFIKFKTCKIKEKYIFCE